MSKRAFQIFENVDFVKQQKLAKSRKVKTWDWLREFVDHSHTVEHIILIENSLTMIKSPYYLPSALYSAQKQNVSCPGLYFKRTDSLSIKRVDMIIEALLASKDVMLQGASGCGKTFMTSDIILELLTKLTNSEIDIILIRIDCDLFRITCSTTTDSATIAPVDNATNTSATVNYETTLVESVGNNIDSLMRHLQNEELYMDKNAVLVLEFTIDEIHGKQTVNLEYGSILVPILFVFSECTPKQIPTLRLLHSKIGIRVFMLEPMTDEVIREMAKAQLLYDPEHCYWAMDNDDQLLKWEDAMIRFEERKNKFGNIPRYLFAREHVACEAWREVLATRHLKLFDDTLTNLMQVPHPSHYFIAPMFRPQVTIPLLIAYKLAAPEAYAEAKAIAGGELEEDEQMQWDSFCVQLKFLTEGAKRHIALNLGNM